MITNKATELVDSFFFLMLVFASAPLSFGHVWRRHQHLQQTHPQIKSKHLGGSRLSQCDWSLLVERGFHSDFDYINPSREWNSVWRGNMGNHLWKLDYLKNTKQQLFPSRAHSSISRGISSSVRCWPSRAAKSSFRCEIVRYCSWRSLSCSSSSPVASSLVFLLWGFSFLAATHHVNNEVDR